MYTIREQYDLITDDKGFETDFEAMLDWLEHWQMKPCKSEYFGEEINAILVKSWIEFRDSLKNDQRFDRSYLEQNAREYFEHQDAMEKAHFEDNLPLASDGHLMVLGRLFYCSHFAHQQEEEETEDSIAVRWSIDDVKSIREDLTDDQAREVLHQADRRHDAEVGINWDVLRIHADLLYPEPEVEDDDSDELDNHIDERYANDIINGRPELYDAIEIHGVRNAHNADDADGTCFEVDDENPEQFSLYLHIVSGGVECVGDFSTRELANQYAEELSKQYKWKVHDFSRAIDPEMLRQLRGFTPNQFVKVDWDLIYSIDTLARCNGEIAVIYNDNYTSIEGAVIDGAVYFASQPICNRYELEGALLGCEATQSAIGVKATLYFASNDLSRKPNL